MGDLKKIRGKYFGIPNKVSLGSEFEPFYQDVDRLARSYGLFFGAQELSGGLFWGTVFASLKYDVGINKLKAKYQSRISDIKEFCESRGIKSVDVNDFNSDGLVDVVIEHNSGEREIYYNFEGLYDTCENIKQREVGRIQNSYIKYLKDANEYFQKSYGDGE